MTKQVFRLPDVGEGLTEAEILSWHVAVGDTVTVNQVLVEIETAKAAVELPSPYAGTVAELLVEPGATVEVGTPIIAIADGSDLGTSTDGAAHLDTAADRTPTGDASGPAGTDSGAQAGAVAEPTGAKIGEAGVDGRIATLVGYGPRPGSVTRRARKTPPPPPRVGVPTPASRGFQHTAAPASTGVAGPSTGVAGPPTGVAGPPTGVAESATGAPATAPVEPGGAEPGGAADPVPLAKPPVRKLARELGVDLRSLAGSGPNGVITRDDVRQGSVPDTQPAAPLVDSIDGRGAEGGEWRVPIRGVRKATAAAMVSSAFTAPHVTEFLTVDVTPTMELRERLRRAPEFAEVKLTPLVFAAKAVCLALRRTPEVNSSWDEPAQEIVYRDRVQLGIAAATPRGLVVPKIRDADTLSLRELAMAITELTGTARAGRTTPAEMLGGTFTITNVGVFGVDTGTPIINPGEAAILALGGVKQAPWVVDGQLAVRTVCQLALSFDHRLVDGEQGSLFLAAVGALLADPAQAFIF